MLWPSDSAQLSSVLHAAASGTEHQSSGDAAGAQQPSAGEPSELAAAAQTPATLQRPGSCVLPGAC